MELLPGVEAVVSALDVGAVLDIESIAATATTTEGMALRVFS